MRGHRAIAETLARIRGRLRPVNGIDIHGSAGSNPGGRSCSPLVHSGPGSRLPTPLNFPGSRLIVGATRGSTAPGSYRENPFRRDIPQVKLQRHGTIACLALTAALALSACGSDNEAPSCDRPRPAAPPAAAINCATGTLNAQGSSAQKNAMDEWRKDYQQQCRGSTINYEPNGSGAGVQSFIAGTADFAGSDTALTAEEQPQAERALRRRPGDQPADGDRPDRGRLQPLRCRRPAAQARHAREDLRRRPSRSGTTAAIKADNASASLPSTTIQTVHRSDESGTTDNFTAYLSRRRRRRTGPSARARRGRRRAAPAPRAPTASPAR